MTYLSSTGQDGDSLFAVSGLIMENYDLKAVDEENNVIPNIKSLTKSNAIHQMSEFSDDPFPAPDWVLVPPPDFYKDDAANGFQSTSASSVWSEETDIFQPFKEKADTDVTQSSSANQNTESCSSSNQSDPLLEFILSRQKKFQATPSPISPSDPANVFQETSTKTNGFFETPSLSASPLLSNTNPTSDDIFKTSSSNAEPKVSNIEAFDPLFDTQNKVQSNQKSNSDLLFAHQNGTKPDIGISHVALQNGAFQEPKNSNGDLMFRRLPKPVPRSKALKGLHQPPAPSQIPSAEIESDLQVYEDVLLIGQDKIGDELKSSETNTNSLNRGSKPTDITDEFFAPDEEQNEATNHKSKKSSKPKIITHRRGSKVKSAEASAKVTPDSKDDLTPSSKHAELMALGEKKAEDVDCKPSFSKDPFLEGDLDLGALVRDSHQISEIDKNLNDEERNMEETDGNADGQESDDAELKGAFGFTPHPDTKDDDGFDDLKGTFGFKPHEFKEDTLMKTEAGRSYSPNNVQSSYSNGFMSPPSWDSKADLETDVHKTSDLFTPLDGNEKHAEMTDCRPKKSLKFKVLRLHRHHSKSTEDSEIKQSKDHEASEMKKPPLLNVPPLSPRDSKSFEEDEFPQKGADLFKAGDEEFAEDIGWEEYTPDNKPQKSKETDMHRRGSKTKDIKDFPEDFLDPPGATSGDFYLSDAAKILFIPWSMYLSSHTFWEEMPANETISSKEEETISFKAVADKVHRGLRMYLKLFMERAELLYQHVLILYGIADDLSNFHHRTKIANITGGTTTAVGGAAAIAGLALVPVTFGASIIISAIGLGVATAGGITAASATISDTINNMHDRKKIELIIMDYEAQLVEMQRCLRFIIEGLCRLRSHPLLRRNNYYTGDWEVRRALQTISLVSDPVDQAEEIINHTLAKLASLQKGIDKYFTKDSKEVKKGCKKEVTAEVRGLAKQLHEGLAELNSIREQLLDASGNI
ncbi:apolipo L6-like protein [Labeo rohita]|uniref:Apolipo L6-like protein n=1 Tax=Labeo rohita TaxID=84645 RepID=A0A498LLH0_LABRO|nr:apolipo L6-like protein [Labeo rohita]